MFLGVYINDLKGKLGNCMYQLYTDDTVICCSGNYYIETLQQLQTMLNKFVR